MEILNDSDVTPYSTCAAIKNHHVPHNSKHYYRPAREIYEDRYTNRYDGRIYRSEFLYCFVISWFLTMDDLYLR